MAVSKTDYERKVKEYNSKILDLERINMGLSEQIRELKKEKGEYQNLKKRNEALELKPELARTMLTSLTSNMFEGKK